MDAANTVPQENRCEKSDRKQGNFHQICGKICVHSSEASTFASQAAGTVAVAWRLQQWMVDSCPWWGLGAPRLLEIPSHGSAPAAAAPGLR